MDLQRIRSALTPEQRAAIDVDAQWRRYRGAAGMEDDDAFLNWLAEQFPQLFDANRTRVAEAPVEVSRVMPARLQMATGVFSPPRAAPHNVADATRIAQKSQARDTNAADSDAPTVLSERSYSPPAASSDSTAPAQQEFHYVILGTAGKGGMGTVHIAKDTELLRRVALKQLNSESEGNAAARSRFLREVQITAQLDHPNIVPVYALEVAPGGTPAYTMKFVEGTTFHQLLNEAREIFESGKFPDETRSLAARLEHFLKVCDAMAYAHDKGVIHRDLKPANLMLGRHNEVYVMDWGLCRVLRHEDDLPADKSMVMSSPDASGSASETQIGDVVGTPKYMSPEQAQGHNQQLDARSDQCALGLILYEMVTLNPPFEGRTAYDVLANAAVAKKRGYEHAYLGKRRVPRDLIAIIERATAFARDSRYASVADFAADIRRYLRGDPVLARPDNVWQRMQRLIARKRQHVLTGILALIALAAIAIGGLLWQNQRLFKAERLREQRILTLSNAASDVSDRVQMRFLQLEGAMVNLADSVSQILMHGRVSEQKYYLADDFTDRERAPMDLKHSATHAGMISLHQPVWVVPPALDQDQAMLRVRKLTVLHAFMRDLYMRAAQMIKGDNVDFYSGQQVPLTEDSSPLNAILVALDDGIAGRYPGWDGLGIGYDARTRPWYKIALGKHGPQWGDSYASSATNLLELPLSIPIYNDAGQFQGVVSAAFLPDLLVKSIFKVKADAAVRAMYLLDANGHVLAATGEAEPIKMPPPDTVVTDVFPLPELVAQVKAGKTGVLEATLHEQKVVVAFDEVAPFGWSVVAVADAKRLLKESDEEVPAY